MHIIIYTINLLFFTYTALLFVRIVGSWFPAFAGHTVMRFIGSYTDPYLNLFRRFIPPIGGVFDLTPLLAYLVLQGVQHLILTIISKL
jgi:Predicted integral membrane protein